MLKIYGPYLRKDGRKHIIMQDSEIGLKKTVSYPRYLMEQHLGRKLEDWETVDHIDGDFTNDDFSNLQILSLADNIRKSAPKRKTYTFVCPCCGKKATKFLNQVEHNWKNGKSGPFCSKSCAGKGSYKNHWKDKNSNKHSLLKQM